MWDLNNYIKTWLRSHICAGYTQNHTDSQKSTVEQEDPEALVDKLNTLFELFGAAILFMWCGNAVPTPLFLALHPYT